MALMVHKSSFPQFEFAPNPEFDEEISTIKDRYESIMERIKTKKITPAEVYYAGATITDQATQTEVSEVVEVKKAIKTLMDLTEDSKNLKTKLNVFYSSTMTEYQDLVNLKANLIYDQCAELLREMQRQNEATLERTRRAYKQQLADAISSLSSMYTKNMQLKLRTVELRQTDLAEKNAAENLRLRDRIRQLEDQVTAMTQELSEMERAKAMEWGSGEQELISVAVSPFTDAKDAGLVAKLQHQEATIAELRVKVRDCELLIQARDAQINKIENDMKDVGSETAKQTAEVNRLLLEKARLENELFAKEERFKNQEAILRAQYEQERHAADNRTVKRPATSTSESSKRASSQSSSVEELKEQLATLELDIENSVEQGKEAERAKCKAEFAVVLENEKARYIALADEKRRVEIELAKERKVNIDRSKEDRDVNAMRSAKMRAEMEAERLRKEIDKVHRMWEKKFSILQASLHALKDEMFVRRYLEKQAAQLHTSAVAFVFGKHAMAQEIPKIQDTTVRAKTHSAFNHESLGVHSAYDSNSRGGNRSELADGAGVPFRPPSMNTKKRRTVWDTRPPTEISNATPNNPPEQIVNTEDTAEDTANEANNDNEQ